ncbi:hypothetical protein LCGC14_0923280 [marine sediment metagenome]|uniref:Uncharacterized protein n=1 Tax=marine sediment metagenome TaxID=412755 RepID=A0A0F9RWN9_9ZZZZ
MDGKRYKIEQEKDGSIQVYFDKSIIYTFDNLDDMLGYIFDENGYFKV